MVRPPAVLAALLVAMFLAHPAQAESPVEQFAPQGEAKQVRQVTARFAEPMVPLGDPRQLDPFDIDCPAAGSGRWVDARNWAYDFDEDLPAGLSCRFVLRKGLATLAGDPVAPGQRFAFSTGGPAIVQSLPYDGDQSIDENQAFLLGLDAPARRASVERGAYCAVEGIGERVPVKLIEGEQRRRILEIHRQFVEEVVRASPAARPPAADASAAGERRRIQWLKDSPNSPLLVLQCARTLPAAARLRLVWGQGIESASGIPSAQDQALGFQVRPAFQASFECERANRKADCIPLLGMRLRFTAPVAFLDAAKVRLVGADGRVYKPALGRSEAIEGAVESLSFGGPFPPNSTFRLELPADLKDDAGRPLANAGRFPLAVRTDDDPPLAKFATGFGIVERGPAAAIPVTLRNLEPEVRGRLATAAGGHAAGDGPVPGRLQRVRQETEILDWLRRLRRASETRSRWDREKERDVVEHRAGTTSVFGPKDRTEAFSLPLSAKGRAFEVVGIPLPGPGFFVAEIASPRLGAALLGERRPFYTQSAALVTNLAVHLKLGRESSLVWVTALDSARPVRNAEVTVRDCGGKVHFSGRTDGQGIARIERPLPRRQALPPCLGTHDRQYFVSARAGDDLGFVLSDWNEGIAPWRFGVPGGNWSGPYVAHAVFDRTLLRAGETVHMKLFLRRQTASGFAVPPTGQLGEKILIRHAGSGQESELAVSWDAHGRAEADWTIPRDAKQGSYEVLVRDRLEVPARVRRAPEQARPAGSFRVESFRVPTMKAVLKGPDRPLIDADAVSIDIQLGYLAGGPAADAPVRLRTNPQPKTVRFADYEAFIFANGDVQEGPQSARQSAWGEEEDAEEGVGPAEEGAAQLQAVGTRSLRLDKAGAARPVIGGLPRADKPMDLAVELEYRDANGETATSATRVALWPAGIVVGIKPDSWVATPENLRFQILALDLAGKPVAGVSVVSDLLLREHYSHRRRVLGGFYAYEHNAEVKRLAPACQGTTDARGLLVCEMRAPRSGNLIVRAVGRDAAGRPSVAHREIWVAAGGDLWFDGGDHDRIDLLPEKKRYEPGETARFQLRMPFREATVLVTVEREGVAETFVRRVSRSKPLIEVPVKAGHAPNVYVSALAVRGRVQGVKPTALVDLGKPAFRMGLAEINVGWDARELKVRVSPDRTLYKVRDKARVRIEVRRSDGRPPPAGSEVALAAVDEGLLELLPNDSWKLLEAMMKRRGLEVETSTAQTQVVGRRHYGRKALPAGGGGGRQSARELFDTLLAWHARVALDANGAAEVEVPLNDSISAFRIVAVADGPDDLFGTGAATVRSSQDLILVSGLPALVRDGDRLHAKFTVRNAGPQALEVKVSAALSASDTGPAGQPVQLPARTLRLAAGEAGEAGWELSIPAQARRLDWEVKAESGAGKPADAMKVSQRVESAVPVRTVQATLARLDRPLQMAVQAPAGALPGLGGVQVDFERTLAGGLSGVRDFMASYPFTCLEQRASQAVALGDAERWRRLVADLPGQLDRDGLAKYFSSMDQGSEVLTAYLLSVAQAAGLALPAAERTRMVEGLKAFVEGRIQRRPDLAVADLAVRKLAAVDALARQGEPVQPQWLESFSIEPNLWPTSALLDWQGILARSPALPQRDERMKEAGNLLRARLNLQGTTLGFSTERGDALWWLMASTDANAARLLLAALDDPSWQADVPRLVRGLLGRQQRGHWATTVANAWGSLALAAFSARFEKEPVEGVAVATLGANRIERRWTADGSRADAGAPSPLPWPAAGESSLSVRQEGSGRPWVSVRSLAAIPLAAPLSSGYRIARTVTPVEQAAKGMWSRGDVARVRLDLDAQADMTWVAVSDPVPAGSQILGTGLGRDSALLRKGEKRPDGPWPAYEERALDAFRAYYAFVPKGRWSLEYTVRFNAAGEFRLPPTRVEALYAPEMFGELPNQPVMVGP